MSFFVESLRFSEDLLSFGGLLLQLGQVPGFFLVVLVLLLQFFSVVQGSSLHFELLVPPSSFFGLLLLVADLLFVHQYPPLMLQGIFLSFLFDSLVILSD